MSENYIYLDCKKINISDETAESLRKQFAKYQFKHGDIVVNGRQKRIIVQGAAGLVSRNRDGLIVCSGQESFVRHGYKKIGSVFTD